MVVVVVEHRRRRPQHICPELLSTRSWGGQKHKKGKPNTPLLELLTQRKEWDGVRPPGRCNKTQRNRAPSTGTGWQRDVVEPWMASRIPMHAENPQRPVLSRPTVCLLLWWITLFSMLPNFTRYSCRRCKHFQIFSPLTRGDVTDGSPFFFSRTQMFIFLLIKILIFLSSLFSHTFSLAASPFWTAGFRRLLFFLLPTLDVAALFLRLLPSLNARTSQRQSEPAAQ